MSSVHRIKRCAIRLLAARPRRGSSGARTPLDGSPQVWTLREGRPTAVLVQLGLPDGVFTEIVKGDLKPGDDLIISERGSRINQ